MSRFKKFKREAIFAGTLAAGIFSGNAEAQNTPPTDEETTEVASIDETKNLNRSRESIFNIGARAQAEREENSEVSTENQEVQTRRETVRDLNHLNRLLDTIAENNTNTEYVLIDALGNEISMDDIATKITYEVSAGTIIQKKDGERTAPLQTDSIILLYGTDNPDIINGVFFPGGAPDEIKFDFSAEEDGETNESQTTARR